MAQQRMNDDAFDKDKNSNNSRVLTPDESDLINTRVHFASLWDTHRNAANATTTTTTTSTLKWREMKTEKKKHHESHTLNRIKVMKLQEK